MTMTVRVFGRLADALGREVRIDEAPATVGQLRRRLADLHPALAPDLLSPKVRIAIDDRMAFDDQSIAPANRIDLLSPLSGG